MSNIGVDLKDYQEINQRFSYSLYNILGGGSFGKVYLGWDHQWKRPIAVKQLLPKTLRGLGGLEKREIQSLQRLKHENIIQFYGTYGGVSSPTGLFLFLELCEEGSLDKHIVKRRPTQAEAMHFFKQLIDGMIYVNSQEMFHRDLKPDNLLLTKDKKLKIADFGTARQYASVQQDTYRRCTPVYAAPEVYLIEQYEAQGGKYSQKCDVFSAGHILYELLTGEKLTLGIETESELISFLRRNKERGFNIEHPALTPRWIVLLRKMLHFDPNQRPTFPQIKEEVERFLPPSNDPTIERPTDVEQRRRSEGLVEQIIEQLNRKQQQINSLTGVLKVMQVYESEASGFIPRVYKLLLLYCTLSNYCRVAEEHLGWLNSPETIVVKDKEVGKLLDEMVREDKARLLQLAEERAARLNKAIEQMRALLMRQVVPALQELGEHGQGDIERRAVAELGIDRAIAELRRGEEIDFLVDSNAYRKCVNNMYQTTAELQTASVGDLRIYLVVLQLRSAMGGNDSGRAVLGVREVVELSRGELMDGICGQR